MYRLYSVVNMDRSQVIKLISETRVQDENGVWRKTGQSFWKDERGYIVTDEQHEDITFQQNYRQVFCQVDSVTQTEFFEGGRNGLNPEYRFTMFAYDYQDERTVEYNGRLYAIYRTYQPRTDIIELYAERKGGTNA